MGRIGRSFQLVGQSYRILMRDKELMVLPLISGAIIAVVLVGMAFGFGLERSRIKGSGLDVYLPLFLMYVVAYAIGIFFQAAVVAGATERMRGGDPTVGSALAAARHRIGPILAWAVVAGTVGLIIRVIHERVGFVGRLVASLVGATWSLATFFVVPVLVLEERSFGDSFARSIGVFKRTWGETIVGGANLGIAAVCAWVTLVALVGLLSYVVGLIALIVFFAGAVVLMVFFSAMNGIYMASLYRYATEGQEVAGFDTDLLKRAFVTKAR
jgi:hypothetical protein